MRFDPSAYGPGVHSLLALDGGGRRLMPLAHGRCSSEEAARSFRAAKAADLFPGARAPEAALSGLWLYFSCLDESHSLSQEIGTTEGSFWHGIMHRQEPDPGNAAYWFRRLGPHPIFPALGEEAKPHLKTGGAWDPFAFIDYCEAARQAPGSERERIALKIQRAEWQLLFDWCARPAR